MPTPTPDEIDAATWDRATLAGWGVPWPPPKGWRSRLEARWWEQGRTMTDAERAADALSTAEVAALLHLTPGELDAWRRGKAGPPFRFLGDVVVYDRADVVAWLLDCRGGASLPA